MRSSSLETLARLGWRTSLQERLSVLAASHNLRAAASHCANLDGWSLHDHLLSAEERVADEFASPQRHGLLSVGHIGDRWIAAKHNQSASISER